MHLHSRQMIWAIALHIDLATPGAIIQCAAQVLHILYVDQLVRQEGVAACDQLARLRWHSAMLQLGSILEPTLVLLLFLCLSLSLSVLHAIPVPKNLIRTHSERKA